MYRPTSTETQDLQRVLSRTKTWWLLPNFVRQKTGSQPPATYGYRGTPNIWDGRLLVFAQTPCQARFWASTFKTDRHHNRWGMSIWLALIKNHSADHRLLFGLTSGGTFLRLEGGGSVDKCDDTLIIAGHLTSHDATYMSLTRGQSVTLINGDLQSKVFVVAVRPAWRLNTVYHTQVYNIYVQRAAYIITSINYIV